LSQFKKYHPGNGNLKFSNLGIFQSLKVPNLRIFQRFRLVKFIEKFKRRVKNPKIEKIIAFDKYLHELFFAFYFHVSKNLFLTLNNNGVADLTHFSTKCGCF